MRQPECPIFRMALEELQQGTFIVQDGRVMMSGGKELTTEDAGEHQVLVSELSAVVRVEEEFTFGELLGQMHVTRNNSTRKKLESALQLLATTFFEQEERVYPEADEEKMTPWARSVTGLNGPYDISDVFGIWAVKCNHLEIVPA